MADTNTSKASGADAKASNATQGDHDRVAMLSLKADGTPDQLNPEIIGDPEWALAATKRQFAEQAVSAVDVAERGATVGGAEELPQDPTVADLQAKHEAAASAAESAAEKAVKSLTA